MMENKNTYRWMIGLAVFTVVYIVLFQIKVTNKGRFRIGGTTLLMLGLLMLAIGFLWYKAGSIHKSCPHHDDVTIKITG